MGWKSLARILAGVAADLAANILIASVAVASRWVTAAGSFLASPKLGSPSSRSRSPG